jgi:hypothetical protein
MNFGSNMYRLGRLEEKQCDIAYRNKHRREVVTLRSVKHSMKTCGGREGTRHVIVGEVAGWAWAD